MAWPAVKKPCTQEEFRRYVQSVSWGGWRPSLIVWHNTAAPSLAQWQDTAAKDRAAGRVPGATRIGNLEQYFRVDRGWSGAPHLFIAPDYIWVFNPLTAPGVHSPSWNAISWGFEMVGDFDREDDDSGDGLKVKNNCIFATAVLCEAIGLDPAAAIKLHREDPATTHACPGSNIARDKAAMIAAVAALLSGGEHADAATPPPAAPRKGIVTVDDLNVRTGPGVSSPAVATLWKNATVDILGEEKNGETSWLKIKTPGGYEPYWVAGRFIHIQGG